MSTDPTATDLTDFIPPEIEEIAELLPAYEILSFIAKGGMGAVYMARQKSLDRDVAIKILPRHFGADTEFRASFEAEAKSMAKLNHPNLISIYDFGQIDGLLYIIMEMVQGKSLHHSSYGKTIDPTEAGRIISGICHGLANAHKHGILHRDIKPANILLDPSASPKIGDFGLARPVGDHESDSAFGTPGYTAPEVIHNPTAVDESTDIYAVGIMLYQLLTSKLPSRIYEPAATLVKCDPRFDQIIRKATHPTPALRYRSAEAMAQAIENVINTQKAGHGKLLKSGAKPSSPAAKTLLTAAPSPKKPNLSINPGTEQNSGSITTASPPPVKLDSNVPFIRNLIIIVALLAAIYIAWEGLQAVRAKRALDNQQVEDINKKNKKETEAQKKQKANERKRSARQHKQPDQPKRPIAPTPPPAKVETPMESLARLKRQLSKGERNEMPKGTITHAGRTRLFIETPMSWHQASQYCESHGGHLAVLPETTDLQWLSSQLKSDHTIWLGAGSAGRDNWSWIDGSTWKQQIRKTSKASYVAVDETGILNPQPATNKHSFFIEWNMNGTNPATLENQLKRCAKSIANGSPQFPAGTTSYTNRNYLLIQHNSEWETARMLAKLGGGNLSVPSNPDENEWILSFLTSSLKKDQACWIGGIRLANTSWRWTTGETWKFAKWGEGLPDESDTVNSACAVLPSYSWDDYPANSTLPSFLIEWSNDGDGHVSIKNNDLVKTKSISSMKKKCATLIQGIQKRYDKDFTNNIGGYEQELSVFKRSLPKGLQQAYGPAITDMQSRYVNNRIPLDIPRNNMPAKLATILDSRLKRQQGIEKKFMSEIEELREKYRNSLSKISKDLENKGLNSQLREVETEIDDSNVEEQDFINHILDEG